jgi:hypothetical protein
MASVDTNVSTPNFANPIYLVVYKYTLYFYNILQIRFKFETQTQND